MKHRAVRAVRESSLVAIGPIGTSGLVGFTVIGAMIYARFDVSVPGLDSDISPITILAPLVAITAIARAGTFRALGFIQNRAFVFMVGPFVALYLLLPWLGVFFNGFDVRTLYALTNVTTSLSFLIIGAAVSGAGVRAWSSWLAIAILAQFLYAVVQAVTLSSGPVADLLAPLVEWDLAVAGEDFIRARSSGLFTNPNILGFWAAMATMLAFSITTPVVRSIALALALLTLVLSQSRGATVALIAAGAVGTVGALVMGKFTRSQLRTLAGAMLLLALLAPVVVVAMPTQSLDRFEALLGVLTEGAAADQNLAGRIDYWIAVTELNMFDYPFGTWGPPSVVLGTAIDSDWYSAFAQGSLALVLANLLLLLAPVGVGSYPGRYALALLAIIIAIAGITQTPLSYSPTILYWALLGSGLQWAVEQRRQRLPRPDRRVRAISRGATGSPLR